MRISTAQIFQTGVNTLLDNQSNLGKTQLQLSTGRKILTPADDPAGSAEILDLGQALAINQQFQDNANAARGRLELSESTLGTVGDLLQRVRVLAIQGNNDTQTPETRRYIATEIREIRDHLIELANQRDANGDFLFAGFKSTTQPFVTSAGGAVSYVGDQNSRYLQIGPSQQIADGDAGSDVFVAIRNGNGTFTAVDSPANTGSGIIFPGTVNGNFVPDTYTIAFTQALPTDPITYSVTGVTSGAVVAAGTAYQDGATISFNGANIVITGRPANGDTFTVSPSANQDIFTTVQNLVNTLESSQTTTIGQTQFHNAVNRVLVDLDQGMLNMTEIRARDGGRLNVIENQKNANDQFTLQVQQSLSDVQDLDYAEAASRLQRQLLSLEAAQQTFVKMQGLSLFNLLR